MAAWLHVCPGHQSMIRFLGLVTLSGHRLCLEGFNRFLPSSSSSRTLILQSSQGPWVLSLGHLGFLLET